MKKKITLKDIANSLGVTPSTVSRALQNNPRISEDVRSKVLKIANELGYFESKFPVSAISSKINAIGVIVPKITYHLYAMAISGMEKMAENHNMHIVICQSDESYEREKDLVDELIKMGVSGLIVSLASKTKDFDHFFKLQKRNIPLVLFNRQCDEVSCDKVVIDNFKASYDATEHLIATGCENIAYIGGPKALQISNTRLLGYTKALIDANVTVDDKLIEYCNFTKESNLSAARKLLYAPIPPDAILAFSDQIAVAAMVAAKERGLRIPEDLAVVGFNNEPVNELLEPSLTSIDQPAFKMGYESVKLIFERIQDESKGITQTVLKSDLIIRNSTNRNR